MSHHDFKITRRPAWWLRIWKLLRDSTARFFEIDGDQRAAAFAYYAFFSLFPLVLIFVTAGSLFVNHDRAANAIIAYIEQYTPLGSGMKQNVFDIVSGVVKSRRQVGVMAVGVFFWIALGFFRSLIRAVNRAWRCDPPHWWRIPVKGLLLLAVMATTLTLGIGLPLLVKFAERRFHPVQGFIGWIYQVLSFLIPLLVLFYGLSLFYKLAPRRQTRFAEVWAPAVFVTLFMRLIEALFVVYLNNFARFNAVYGALGGVMALLVWIWLSGCLVVFGACLCAVGKDQIQSPPAAGS